MYYKQGTDFNKLDVSGAGSTYIRNGDYVMLFEKGKLNFRKLPSVYQENSGQWKHTIDEIVNYKEKENPFKLNKGKDGKIALMDSSGKAIDVENYGKKKKSEGGTSRGTGKVGRVEVRVKWVV